LPGRAAAQRHPQAGCALIGAATVGGLGALIDRLEQHNMGGID
jgi:hypothetical protein